MASAWESDVFTELLPKLVSTLTPDAMLRECEARKLIKPEQRQKFACYLGPAAQNEALIDAVRVGDDKSFHIFLECIRKVEPMHSVSEILAKLGRIDKFREASTAEPASASAGASAADSADRRAAAQLVQETYSTLPNLKKSLRTIRGLDEFGEEIAEFMNRIEKKQLARELVSRAGGFVNNYENIIESFIENHRRGAPTVNNVSGQLHYINKKIDLTCEQLLEILAEFLKGAALQGVAKIIARTEFSS